MRTLILLTGTLISLFARAQQDSTRLPDSLDRKTLQEVVVTAYQQNLRLAQVPAAIGVLTPAQFNRFSNISIVSAFNSIPGVRMEERSPGSYRLSFRGSTLRSPFGVRNVKVYLDGIPFTDPKRLMEKCGLPFNGAPAHEPSSVFIYEMIDAFGGADAFYGKFYIHSVCPLGFTKPGKNGREINYNYYDSRELTAAVYDFIIDNIKKQIALGLDTDLCFCFGTGKNEKFLRQLNEEKKFFKKIIALEHPRFIMQYKSKSKKIYLDKYTAAFRSAL